MFQSFTGSARRQRQVNLSNRSSVNPFAANPPSKRPPPSAQNTLAVAQQERLQRQLNRERANAILKIQRTWRGHRSRKATRNAWRTEWDQYELQRNPGYQSPDSAAGRWTSGPPTQYLSASDCVRQLQLLLAFIQPTNQDDAVRLGYFARAFQKTVEEMHSFPEEGEWTPLLSRLVEMTFRVILISRNMSPAFVIDDMLRLLIFLTKLIPRQMAHKAREYYQVMATLTTGPLARSGDVNVTRALTVQAVIALLQPITSDTLEAYEWFARVYLTVPALDSSLESLRELAAGVNYKLLASVLVSHVLQSSQFMNSDDVAGRTWLLAYFIYFQRNALGSVFADQAPEIMFVKAVSALLSSIAGEISQRMDMEEDSRNGPGPLPHFVRTELLSLVNQKGITQLLSRADIGGKPGFIMQAGEEAKALATYALTLLRIFPRRGDEIRMWLYLGSTADGGSLGSSRMPAIKYFWNATRSTSVYHTVTENPPDIAGMLKAPVEDEQGVKLSTTWQEREQEWTVILLFLELYTFLLKVLDDEEFFSGKSQDEPMSGTALSWTKESTLSLLEVKDLTVFLKSLAFTLYWNAAELTSDETEPEHVGIRDYFNIGSSPTFSAAKPPTLKTKKKTDRGVSGMPLDYSKGLVTGLLRMIHERE